MEKTTNTTDMPEKDVSFMGKTLQWAVYPFSLAAGYIVTKINVSNSAYDNIKDTGAFDIEKADFQTRRLEIGARAKAALAANQEFDFSAAIKKVVDPHDSKIASYMKRLKVGNFLQQWENNSPFQKQNALLAGFTAAGIAVAVGAMITDSKRFREWFSDKKDDQEHSR